MPKSFEEMALDYHREPVPGKLEVVATKPLGSQRDLSLAYSPGVAAACMAIAEDPATARDLTTRGNLVAVVSNGTAVLGLGAIGPLAAKPVMEGKAVLFKRFAGINVFDIEIDAQTPAEMIETIRRLEPTFGGINLEDIKAPECFEVERELKRRMSIPVFHDDQHGTAIVAGAAVVNGLHLAGKDPASVKVVAIGAGAAGIACLNLFAGLGVRRENVWLYDRKGLITSDREGGLSEEKARYARPGPAVDITTAIAGADVFLGVSGPGGLTAEMVKTMAPDPLILALANPVPEIMPEAARAAREDAIVATGRSDYPNQVNNVLCFPFIFRGALDVGATEINEAMKVACVKAIAGLARAEGYDSAANSYADETFNFGRDYVIPRPFDPRLILEIAPAVAGAAMESGVATRPIEDLAAYRQSLTKYVYRTGMLMKPIFERARRQPKRVVFAEGEDYRVLHAVQVMLDEGWARPILVGRPDVIASRIARLGLRLRLGEDVEICDPGDDPRYDEYWRGYHDLTARLGVSVDAARTIIRTNTTAIAALMVKRGEADAMLCGTYGQYHWHLEHVERVTSRRSGGAGLYALAALTTDKGVVFLADTHACPEPDRDQVVEMTLLGAEQVRRFGLEPAVALVSHSNFGSHHSPSALKMREATAALRERAPELEVDGEMRLSAALDPELRARLVPNSPLRGVANFLVFPNMDAANAAFHLLVGLGNAMPVGPMLLGAGRPAHVLTPTATARGVLNMAALAVVEAQTAE